MGGKDRIDWEVGIIYRMDAKYYIQNGLKNKVVLYSTGNYIQHPVINQYGKECIYR